MSQQEPDESILSDYQYLDRQEKKLLSNRWVVILVLLVVVIGCFNVGLPVAKMYRVFDKIYRGNYLRRAILRVGLVVFVFLPLACLALSLASSLIPYKNYSYSQKIIPFTLCTVFFFEFILLVALIAG